MNDVKDSVVFNAALPGIRDEPFERQVNAQYLPAGLDGYETLFIYYQTTANQKTRISTVHVIRNML
jgi:hypothetical protein